MTDQESLADVHRADIEWACQIMHDAYEKAAVEQGWQTQEASRVPWSEVPEPNKATMRIAVGAFMQEYWGELDRLRRITNAHKDANAELAREATVWREKWQKEVGEVIGDNYDLRVENKRLNESLLRWRILLP